MVTCFGRALDETILAVEEQILAALSVAFLAEQKHASPRFSVGIFIIM